MEQPSLIVAALLGTLEGLTEFLPVSSTGHLLIAREFLGLSAENDSFTVPIQLGAILALVAVFGAKLLGVAQALPHDPAARRFVAAIVIAFLPAAFLGVVAHDFIKTVLFDSPRLIAVMLIAGGLVLLWVDHKADTAHLHDAMRFPLPVALGIGLFQCLALVPGVSRSGATIVGGLLLGADRRAAAEFSFFLSMPTMAGAFVYDLYAMRDTIDLSGAASIAVGFAAAFVAAIVVVRWLLDYLGRHGYALFAWWRIALGAVVLAALAF